MNQINSDDCNVLYEIANYLDHGFEIDRNTIVEENKKQAFELYKKASTKGSIESKIRLADFYSEGNVCELNLDLAIELYEFGIKNGHGIAAHNLATLYRDLRDFSKAFQLYKTAQSLGGTNSIELAYCYYYGIGTEPNKEESLEIFQKIADETSENRNSEFEIEDANYYLGLYYLEGLIVHKSINKAREYFEIANIDNDHRNANEILLMIGRIDDGKIKTSH